MTLTKRLSLFTAAISMAGAPARAADGILIAQKITSGGNTTTHQSQIEKTRMRSEIAGQNGRRQTIIFDAGAQVLRIIDDQAKTYSEMTKADIDRMSTQMSAAMAQMQQQMQNLPPEQRARLEAMMQGGRGMIGAVAGPPPEYKKVGTDTVGKWTCDRYEGTKNGEKSSELCTVAPTALGFSMGDFEITKQFAEFFSRLMPQGVEALFRIGSSGPTGFSGIPVRAISYKGGAPQTVTEMTEASRQNFPDALFAVPAGYQKRDFPGAGRGRQ
jgi:hypothetical protein